MPETATSHADSQSGVFLHSDSLFLFLSRIDSSNTIAKLIEKRSRRVSHLGKSPSLGKREGQCVALLERSILNTEVDLGITFARIAKAQRADGNGDHYEASKQNVIAALEAIDRFKDRLPHDLKMKIEARRS